MPKNFQQLRSEALKANREVFDKVSGKMVKRTFTESEALQATVEYFLRGGLDYKGQFQSCFETKGGGLQIDLSIDPGKIFSFGFLSTEIGVSGSGTRSREIILVAQRGPSQLQYGAINLTIPQPIMINCLSGVHWEGAVKASIDVSLGISYSIGSDGEKTESSFDESEEEESGGDLKLQLECKGIGFTAEAKVGAAAEAGYTYENFFAVDVCPIPFENELRITKVSAMLADLFTAKSYKALMKKRACDFSNTHFGFENISYEGYFFGHISSADICKSLAKGIAARGSTKDSASLKAQSIIDGLQCWADENAPPKVSTSAFISSHKAEGKAGVYAKAELSVEALVAAAGVSAKAEGPTIGGEYKSSTVRYQTAYSAPLQKDYENKFYDNSYVIMTQDTKIVYSKLEFTACHVTAEASVSDLFGNSKKVSTEDDKYKKIDEALTFGNIEVLNRLTYTTVTVFWHMHYPSRAISQRTPNKQKQSFEVGNVTLQGTGVSLGGSFMIENLLKFYDVYDSSLNKISNKTNEKSFMTLAKSIGLSLADLIKFLADPFTEILLRDLKEANNIEVVLIEVSFPVSETDIIMIHTVNGKKELTELAPDTAKKILGKYQASSYKSPEVVRLRYRMQDMSNRDSDLFKLGGFKVAGNGGGITLKEVNRAGSESIVDLHTLWFDATANSRNDQTINYENGVPQVALFCQ